MIKRGSELPQTKLTDDDVKLIRQCVLERERLREEAKKLSNEALAEKFEVHTRTIDRVTQYRGWIHVGCE
jgi:predicted DNA-binding transcriptional regulator YafY